MNGLDLFAGAGTFTLALRNIIPGYRTICYVEIEPYRQGLLITRIADGYLDDAPIWDDIRTFDGRPLAGMVNIITAGFPCQPYSNNGKRIGEDDPRNLWPDTRRIISEVGPEYILLENVPNLLTFEYSHKIFGQLATLGYGFENDVVSAAFVGAWHLRKRVWILAHAEVSSIRSRFRQEEPTEIRRRRPCNLPSQVEEKEEISTDTESRRLSRNRPQGEQEPDSQEKEILPRWNAGSFRGRWWDSEPRLARLVHGTPSRMERLKTTGEGIVPQVVKRILEVSK